MKINNAVVNSPFTGEEISKGIQQLQNEKANGHDSIRNEMFKSV